MSETTSSTSPLTNLDYRPAFPPGYAPGVGIVGCGAVVREWHLPAYARYGVNVVGVFDRVEAVTRGLRDAFPFVEVVYPSLDELLADPRIDIVDIATGVDVRLELIEKAVAAGKHVLAQKPLALDLGAARETVEEAERRGVRFAVNQNGRWAPPWRVATLLVEDGAIGDVVAVTHLLDKPLPPLVGTHFEEVEHFTIFDYFAHWIDISRCWLDNRPVAAVRAHEYRPPHQPDELRTPSAAWIEILYEDGADVMMRCIGDAQTRRPSCPFWVHGTAGTLRGSVLLGSDFLELERDGITSRFALDGAWFPDGFAGTLAELACAIADEREPFNSARHNLLSLGIALAACRSAEEESRPVSLDQLDW
jgi:predicted dehydrogenase